jgi:hypothetical protein
MFLINTTLGQAIRNRLVDLAGNAPTEAVRRAANVLLRDLQGAQTLDDFKAAMDLRAGQVPAQATVVASLQDLLAPNIANQRGPSVATQPARNFGPGGAELPMPTQAGAATIARGTAGVSGRAATPGGAATNYQFRPARGGR